MGAGAFGCVFRPALRCASQKTPTRGFVTKLGRAHHIEEEKATIDTIGVILRDIPHYENYFVIDDITVCQPAPLQESDMQNVEQICHNFKGVNINEQLPNLRALNMPDAGQDLFDYFSALDGIFDEQVFLKVNNSLMRLVEHGIMPMSIPGIIHSDVKLENMVIDTSTFNIRLIDWGNAKTTIPNMLRPSLTPFVFNQPPGSVFLHTDINEMLAGVRAQQLPEHVTLENRAVVSKNLAIGLRQLVPEADTMFMDIIIKFQFGTLLHPTGSNMRHDMIDDHLASILYKYYDFNDDLGEAQFNQQVFINETYKQNCDLYGFVVSYVLMFATMTSFEFTDNFDAILRSGIINPFIYRNDYASKPMNRKVLLDMMKELSACVSRRCKKRKVVL